MKRITTLLIGLFVSTGMAFAQGNGQTTGNGTGNNNGPMWRLDGNAGTDIAKPHFIGTVDAMGLAFRTDDVEHMRITAAGDVGIGIDVPLAKLHVVGDAIIDGLLDLSGDLSIGGMLTVDGATLLNNTLDVVGNTGLQADLVVGGNTSLTGTLGVTGNSTFSNATVTGNLGVNGTTTTNAFTMPTGAVNGHILSTDGSGSASWIAQQTLSFNTSTYDLTLSQGNTVNLGDLDDGWEYSGSDIYFTGDVAIGSSSYASGYELSVDGEIACEEVLVDASGSWPDYVFASNYELMPLSELRTYISLNNHLPGVPDAKTVEENGVQLGEMQRVLLEKVEELTLYVIEQQKTIEELQTEIEELSKSH